LAVEAGGTGLCFLGEAQLMIYLLTFKQLTVCHSA